MGVEKAFEGAAHQFDVIGHNLQRQYVAEEGKEVVALETTFLSHSIRTAKLPERSRSRFFDQRDLVSSQADQAVDALVYYAGPRLSS
jgi:hypothetical protein